MIFTTIETIYQPIHQVNYGGIVPNPIILVESDDKYENQNLSSRKTPQKNEVKDNLSVEILTLILPLDQVQSITAKFS